MRTEGAGNLVPNGAYSILELARHAPGSTWSQRTVKAIRGRGVMNVRICSSDRIF